MSELPTIRPESRMLIDGRLVEARDGATFEVINPANQAVVGSVADATADDMGAAIDAARRAFDETTWSTDRELRKQCLMQLQDALDREGRWGDHREFVAVGFPAIRVIESVDTKCEEKH